LRVVERSARQKNISIAVEESCPDINLERIPKAGGFGFNGISAGGGMRKRGGKERGRRKRKGEEKDGRVRAWVRRKRLVARCSKTGP